MKILTFISTNRKLYKILNSNKDNMIPGDPNGSPDESLTISKLYGVYHE